MASAVDDVTISIVAFLEGPAQPLSIEFRGLLRIARIQVSPAKRADVAKHTDSLVLTRLKNADAGASRILNNGKASDVGNIGGRDDLLTSRFNSFCCRFVRVRNLYIEHPVRRYMRIQLFLHQAIPAADVFSGQSEHGVGHARSHWNFVRSPTE